MPTAVDLFAGAGGISAGLRKAGWEIIAASDNDPAAARTYCANHSSTSFVMGDIQLDTTVERLANAVGRRKVDAVFIAAPCQPFSSQNKKRGGDARELLIVRALEVVRRLKPGLVFFENVTGLTTKTYRPVVDAVRFELMALGYIFSGPHIHNASDFGVPQRRRRCVMLAARSQAALDVFEVMAPNFPRTTVRDAIADLPPLRSGDHDTSDIMHRAREHSPIALERLRHIPRDGGSRKSLPACLRLACHTNDFSFPDVYGRMKWSSQCMTLTTGCTDITKGRYAHPDQDRAITAREAARLQTFADDYIFEGNGTQVARQIGNAVPPLMIERLAPTLESALRIQAQEKLHPQDFQQAISQPIKARWHSSRVPTLVLWVQIYAKQLVKNPPTSLGHHNGDPYPKLRGPPVAQELQYASLSAVRSRLS